MLIRSENSTSTPCTNISNIKDAIRYHRSSFYNFKKNWKLQISFLGSNQNSNLSQLSSFPKLGNIAVYFIPFIIADVNERCRSRSNLKDEWHLFWLRLAPVKQLKKPLMCLIKR